MAKGGLQKHDNTPEARSQLQCNRIVAVMPWSWKNTVATPPRIRTVVPPQTSRTTTRAQNTNVCRQTHAQTRRRHQQVTERQQEQINDTTKTYQHDTQQEHSKKTAHTARTSHIHRTACASRQSANRRNTRTTRTGTLPNTRNGLSQCQLEWPTTGTIPTPTVAAVLVPQVPAQPAQHALPIRAGSPPTRAASQGRRHHGGSSGGSTSATSHLHVVGSPANPRQIESRPTPGPRLASRGLRHVGPHRAL